MNLEEVGEVGDGNCSQGKGSPIEGRADSRRPMIRSPVALDSLVVKQPLTACLYLSVHNSVTAA